MPYIINVPHMPRPYVTNNPAVYMDCLSWGWQCESRPFSDSYCKATRKREEARYEADKRAEQLDNYYSEELARRTHAKRSMTIANLDIVKSVKPFQGLGRHSKHDSLTGVAVFDLGLDGEEVDLSD